MLFAALCTAHPVFYTPQISGAAASRARAATQEIVFMLPIANALVPSPNSIYEVAVMNLDGTGFRQLTGDGKFKFLPHFSPDATKITYTKFSVGGYGDPFAVYDVAVYDVTTGQEIVITRDGDDAQGTWSPDGKRLAFIEGRGGLGATEPTTIWTIDADGSNRQKVANSGLTPDDLFWGDVAWSSDDWILFTVAQNVNGCFKTRTDKIRPDGSSRTQVSDGGPNCIPAGMEQSGDADPGWSADGKAIFSSRGFPVPPAGLPQATERKLYSFSSDAWYPGKPELDLSFPSEPSCIEGVPKGSPDGKRVLLFRACFDRGMPKAGIYVTDTSGSYRTFITKGFGPDWNPLSRSNRRRAVSH